MEINENQFDAFSKDMLDRMITEMQDFIRAEAPRTVADFDDEGLRAFCLASTRFGLKHGLELQAHFVELSLYLLRMKVDFEAVEPPDWVAAPRIDGSMPDEAKWLDHVRGGSVMKLS